MPLIQQLSVEAGLKAEQDLLASVCAGELDAGVLFWQPTDRALVMPRRLSRLSGFEQASLELADSGWPILLRETGGEPVPQSASTINIALVYAPARAEGDHGRIETAYRRLCEPICDLLTELGGGGLGRAYALAFAGQGANVVVNDIRREAAEEVAVEIREAGGQAIANADDITTIATAQNIVDAALAAFGEVHVLVNNAGILRDRMFISLAEDDWDAVMRVHLKGHYCLANILGKRWRDLAKAGQPVAARIINTSSGAGLQGSVGQSNYSAAKGGIAALTLVQAAELARYGVTANALAPAARTSMTESAMPDVVKKPEDGGFDAWAPENVAPLVVWLGSELSGHVSGQIIESQGGRLSLGDGWRTGVTRDKGAQWQPEEVGVAMGQILAEAPAPQRVWGS